LLNGPAEGGVFVSDITTIALDPAKSVFHLHGADEESRPVLRKTLRRGQEYQSGNSQKAAAIPARPAHVKSLYFQEKYPYDGNSYRI